MTWLELNDLGDSVAQYHVMEFAWRQETMQQFFAVAGSSTNSALLKGVMPCVPLSIMAMCSVGNLPLVLPRFLPRVGTEMWPCCSVQGSADGTPLQHSVPLVGVFANYPQPNILRR